MFPTRCLPLAVCFLPALWAAPHAGDRVVGGDLLVSGPEIVAIGAVEHAVRPPARVIDARGCAEATAPRVPMMVGRYA